MSNTLKLTLEFAIDQVAMNNCEFSQQEIQDWVHSVMSSYSDGRYPFPAEMITKGIKLMLDQLSYRKDEGCNSMYPLYWHEHVASEDTQ